MAPWDSVLRLDGVRVLVVEDVSPIRELVASALELCGPR
jgi:CheY-like chemotaxis protein